MSKARIMLRIFICSSLLITQTALAKNILVYGDSLSAAYGLSVEQGWAALLSKRLEGEHVILNASISGETTAGGLARLPATLDSFSADLVLLELGANDGLRGQSLEKMRANLTTMTELMVSTGAKVVIFGISLPPSYGPRYIEAFEAVFPEVADATQQTYFEFVVERFIGNSEMIQSDGLHPTAEAQIEIEQLVFDFLETEALLD